MGNNPLFRFLNQVITTIFGGNIHFIINLLIQRLNEY